MGFLSIFSRKPAFDSASESQFKGQSYHSTTAAQPPVLGHLPVAGNGHGVLEELQKAARKRSQAQLSSVRTPSSLSGFDDAVSLRSCPQSAAGSARASAGARPRRLSQHSTHLVSDHGRAFGLRPRAAVPPVPKVPAAHSRDGSVRSAQSRGFVDLLDAQSQIRPSNFWSRVEASGARDYGEDVAERNISEKAHEEVVLSYRAVPGNELSRSPRSPQHRDEDSIMGQPGTKTDPVASSLMSAGLATVTGSEPRQLPAIARNRRRRPGQAAAQALESLAQRPKSQLGHRSPEQNAEPASPPSVPRYRKIEQQDDPVRVTQPSLQSREAVLFAKGNRAAEFQTSHRRRSRSWSHSSFPGDQRHAPSSNHGQDANSGTGGQLPGPAPGGTEGSAQALPDTRESISMGANWTRSDKRPHSHHGWNGIHSHDRAEPSAHQPRPSSSSSSSYSHSQARSTGGMCQPGRSQLDDISEHIPPRKSSWGQSALSVDTPTTESSVQSSAPFPPSQHTANTSLDLPPSAPSVKAGHHRHTSGSAVNSPHPGSLPHAAAARTPSPRTLWMAWNGPAIARSGQVDHGDDLVSDKSETDSFVEAPRWRREKSRGGEEELLFKEGHYGNNRDALPGLFEELHERPVTYQWAETGTVSKAPISHATARPDSRSFSARDRPFSRSHRNDPVGALHPESSSDQDGSNASSAEADCLSRFQALLALAALGGSDAPTRLDLLCAMLENTAETMDSRSAQQRRKRQTKRRESSSRKGKSREGYIDSGVGTEIFKATAP